MGQDHLVTAPPETHPHQASLPLRPPASCVSDLSHIFRTFVLLSLMHFVCLMTVCLLEERPC